MKSADPIEYAVRCPKCRARAVAFMVWVGNKGTYREMSSKMGASRIVCGSCGFCRDIPLEESGDYELWYVADFDGHRLWANSRRHLDFLIQWLSSDGRIRELDWWDRSYLEALPKWLRARRDREEILARLVRMRAEDGG